MTALRDRLRQVAQSRGGSPIFLMRRADRARDAKDWPEAARLYAEAAAVAPARDDIWVQHGHALKEAGQRAEAENAYRRALAINAQSPDTHLQLGHVLKLLGRHSEAAEAYLRALELNPHQFDALGEINRLAARGVYAPRERLLKARVTACRPTFPWRHGRLRASWVRRGRRSNGFSKDV